MKKPLSLTLRLFLLVSALNILTMCVVGILGLRSANLNISEEYDAQLITEASVLWEIIEEDSKDGTMGSFQVESFNAESTGTLLERDEQDSLLDYAQWRAFRVWHDDQIVMHSDNTDTMPKKPLPQGLSNISIAGETWRVFALHDVKNGLVVETYENLHDRGILDRDILLDILAPLLVMLPILAILFSIGVRFGLKGLRQLARRLSVRAPSDFSYFESSDLPKELQPLGNSVNALLTKIEGAFAHEREFIDHAAHELRTPLSALKLQAQMLAKSLTDPESKATLDDLLASVGRTSKLVDQLLLMSRVAQQNIALEPVNIHHVAKEAINMMAVRIVDKHIHLSLGSDESLTVMAQPELLRTMISTILDNAIKYTPDGSEITVTIKKQDGKVFIAVTDSGKGIPEEEREKVFDRFYRSAHTTEPGSGLGLAIASQIAERLGANIRLETPASGKGLQVVIVFPA